MTPYGPMRRMQKHKPRGKAPIPAKKEATPGAEPLEPVKKSPKRSPGYYRYVLELHKSVSSKFKDEDNT